ncbi:hypothetical protein HPB52_017610 [Rhipicephalus sanguineus]|uniref:Uncharacterized protein n=1 Tax=Rhipicephalus sanguineus TaxID=34632 RepID=A0A9D4SRA1_RHISA|nr:hypothetical protein HPB52_017610 [Rhipicephalus sanguineus]
MTTGRVEAREAKASAQTSPVPNLRIAQPPPLPQAPRNKKPDPGLRRGKHRRRNPKASKDPRPTPRMLQQR